MRPEYIESMYRDWLKHKDNDELLAVIDYIIKMLKRRKKVVFAKIVIKDKL